MILLIYLKIYETENGKIIAMCDEDLIDKIFEDNELYIDIKNYSDFYKGDLKNANDIPSIEELGNINSANIIGNESTKIAIKKSIIDKTSIKLVAGIPYAQSFRMIE